TSALLVVILAGLTRALHLDGLMDCCDALFGGYTRERRLEILKDSRVGAFAVAGGAGALLLEASAISALPGGLRTPILVLFPALGRWGIVMCMALFPLATDNTTARGFTSSHVRRNTLAALATVAAASFLLAGPLGLALLAAGTALAWVTARWAAGLLGGLTGDVYGAVDKVVEIAALLLAVGLHSAWPQLLAPVLPGLA
ncbi:MAG: adenosylcobinamide-GDP ribazoletransferase, partial [Chloroflexota bacterium]